MTEYDVGIIWISTYNYEGLIYSLTEFEARTDQKKISYFHYIVDSSLGEQQLLKEWVVKRNNLSKKNPELPRVECFFCSQPLAVTSKKNIAFSNISKRCRFIIELEDDITIHSNSADWLLETVNYISQKEAQGIKVYWNLNYGVDKHNYNGGSGMGSVATLKSLYPLPSQITGEFINPIHEMMDFPYELYNKILRLQLSYEGSENLYLKYDIASRSTNYSLYARAEFDTLISDIKIKYAPKLDFSTKNQRQIFEMLKAENIISKEQIESIYERLFKEFKETPLLKYPIIPGTEVTEEVLADRFLFIKKLKHFSVPLTDYRVIRNSICLTKQEFFNFLSTINKPEIINVIKANTVNFYGIYAISVMKPEFEVIRKQKDIWQRLLAFLSFK